jgi:hypothetical protein
MHHLDTSRTPPSNALATHAGMRPPADHSLEVRLHSRWCVNIRAQENLVALILAFA